MCPGCGSLERHRLLWLYLSERGNLTARPLRILHLAPEPILARNLRALGTVTYVSADLEAPAAMIRSDIARLAFEDATFDAVLCVHLLEHVPDDRAAVREVFRVLKPGGWALLQSPIDLDLAVTAEGPDLAPDERARRFGQPDHLRMFGCDYPNRLAQAGFRVTREQYARELGSEAIRRYALHAHEDIYVCEKPGKLGRR